jgi:hypothetical protein
MWQWSDKDPLKHSELMSDWQSSAGEGSEVSVGPVLLMRIPRQLVEVKKPAGSQKQACFDASL